MTRYFKDSEFYCKCGNCAKDHTDIDKFSLSKLDEARHIAGIPFVLNSSIRCVTQNHISGGRPNSAHLTGQAFDIKATDSASRYIILTALLRAGFSRVGIAKGFIHADDDATKPQRVCWLYS